MRRPRSNETLMKQCYKARTQRRGRPLPVESPVEIFDTSPWVIKSMLKSYFTDGSEQRKGRFIAVRGEPPVFTALNNSEGQMELREFDDRFAAERWLKNKEE